MAKGKGKIIPPYVIGDLTHTWGGLNTSKSDTRFLERGESFDSLNWITGTQKDNIQLRRGKQLIGQTNRNGNPVTGLGVGVLNNGNEVPFFTYDRKIMIYDKNIELIDYYFNSQSTDDQALSDDIKGAAQTFTVLKKIQIDFCKFSLKKVGSPVGNAVAKIYNISGTFGTDAIPSGIPLATSDPFDISTITTLYSLYSFKFTGLNKITLNEGQYAVSIEYPNMFSACLRALASP